MEDKLNSDSVIYHYTKASTAINQILPNSQLRFSRLGDSNDPLEYKLLFPGVAVWGPEEGLSNLTYEASSEINRLRQRDFRMISFCKNREAQTSGDNNMDLLGYAKSRMWSQYGDKHEGVCLALDKNLLLNKINELKIDTVYADHTTYKYTDMGRAINLDGNAMQNRGVKNYCLEHVKNHNKIFFFTKNPDYKDENEFRIVVYSNTEEAELYVDIADSLVGIIIGDRFPDGYLPSLKYIAEKLNVKCRRLYWYHGKPHLLYCAPISTDLRDKWNDLEMRD